VTSRPILTEKWQNAAKERRRFQCETAAGQGISWGDQPGEPGLESKLKPVGSGQDRDQEYDEQDEEDGTAAAAEAASTFEANRGLQPVVDFVEKKELDQACQASGAGTVIHNNPP
jgi:hypothetical protein